METPRHGPDGVLLVDKPPGNTSTRALGAAKRVLQARKAGHTGTLDPFATGLLALVFGEATKFSRFLIDARKSYRATLRLGQETSTGDTEGPVTRESPVAVELSAIDEVIHSFRGVHQQIPPMHSAVRVGGKRLYEYARSGQEVERAARRIEIEALSRVAVEGSDLILDVTCSKGTYVRSLAMDIGRALGCGAHLVALRRTMVGPFSLDEAVGIEELQAKGCDWGRARLLPPDALVAELARMDATREAAERFCHGQLIEGPCASAGQEVALFGPGRRFLGVGRCDPDGRIAPLRLISDPEAKSPDFA